MAKKTVVKNAAVKKPAAKKGADKKAVAKKPAPKKAEAKKVEAKKVEAKKVDTKKVDVKKVTAKAQPLKAQPTKAVPAKTTPVKSEPVKVVAAKSSAVKDQGDMLIEKAKEEMANINSHNKVSDKSSKVKPIKIERGNLADEKAKWQELFKRHGKDKASAYKMTETFEAMQPLQHKVLGWGFILSNENNRLEVLFENGIKMLISNYKPS